MLHPTYLGYFDRDAAKRGKLVTIKEIDMNYVRDRLERVGHFDVNGIAYIDRDRFEIYANFLRCMDFVRSPRAAMLIAEIASDTRCDILFLEAGEFLNVDQFIQHFSDITAYRNERLAQLRAERGTRPS